MRAFLRPSRPDLRVSYPGDPKRFLPAEGAEVELDTTWRRALHRGDVVKADPPPAQSPPRKRARKDDDD